jgi:hypothetical protein
MRQYEFTNNEIPDIKALLELYNDAGWRGYYI